MAARIIVILLGSITLLSVFLLASVDGRRPTEIVGDGSPDGVGDATVEEVRSLIESCQVLTMGRAHGGSVGVVLKNGTYLDIRGPEASEFFYEMLGAQDAFTPDRCQIVFSVE